MRQLENQGMPVLFTERTKSATLRGERLYPARSSRVYWVLTRLREELEAVATRACTRYDAPLLVDYGCGNFPYRPVFEKLVRRYIAVDLPGNELADLETDATGCIPIEPETADIVLSNQVLEHVPDVAHYLSEAHRVLGPKGTLILTTHGAWKYHPDPGDYWRWTSAGLRKQLTDSGFVVERFTGLLGPEATAIQLWQDAVLPRVPRRFRSMFTRYAQRRIQRADYRCSDRVRNDDACVYVAVATKE